MNSNIDIKSTWSCDNELNIASSIKLVEDFQSTNVIELLSEDQAVILKPSHSALECSLYIQLKDYQIFSQNIDENGSAVSGLIKPQQDQNSKILTNYFDKILVLSEAKLIEVYKAEHMEYVTTIDNNLLSDFGDSKLYQCIIPFDQNEKSIILKMKGLFCKESLWIYGIFIKTKQIEVKKTLGHFFNKNNIDAVIKNRNITLSENAENFHKLIKICEPFKKLNDSLGSATLRSENTFATAITSEDNVPSHKTGTEFEMDKITQKMKNLYAESNVNLENDKTIKMLKVLASKASPLISSTTGTAKFSEMQPSINKSINHEVNDQIEKTVCSIVDKRLKEFEENIITKLETKIDASNKEMILKLSNIENMISQLSKQNVN